MEFYISDKDDNWPAQERLCRSLGISYSRANTESSAFHLRKAVFSYLIKKPLRLYRLLLLINEYWNCKLYLHVLKTDGDKVRTAQNKEIVDQILDQAGQNLVRESPDDWSEIVGLHSQKLAHLKYYEELIRPQNKRRKTPITTP